MEHNTLDLYSIIHEEQAIKYKYFEYGHTHELQPSSASNQNVSLTETACRSSSQLLPTCTPVLFTQNQVFRFVNMISKDIAKTGIFTALTRAQHT